MAMENEPFEDVFPIENGDFPASYVIVYRIRRTINVGRYSSPNQILLG